MAKRIVIAFVYADAGVEIITNSVLDVLSVPVRDFGGESAGTVPIKTCGIPPRMTA
jgi:hypothetical protein